MHTKVRPRDTVARTSAHLAVGFSMLEMKRPNPCYPYPSPGHHPCQPDPDMKDFRSCFSDCSPSSFWSPSTQPPSLANGELDVSVGSSEAQDRSRLSTSSSPPKPVGREKKGVGLAQSATAAGPVKVSSLKAHCKELESTLGNVEDFVQENGELFTLDKSASPTVRKNTQVLPLPARKLHFRILTLLALSPTYSYDLEKLRCELGWNEQRHGNFHNYLCTLRHEGKKLYALTVSNGRCRIHLIKDIYLNAVSQKLRAFHEKYYRTSSQPLSVDVLRRFVNWECSARDFKDWLINHGLSKLLAPPSTSTPDAASDNPPRPARPQIICCARDLSVALGFVRQQYNLISLVCYVTSTADSRPRLSLVRLTQANKQVLLIDVLALAEEARLLWRGSRDCDIKQAPFVKELKDILSNEEIRKCVWNFKWHRSLFMDQLGIQVNSLIDLYPICQHFFPEYMDGDGDSSGMDCTWDGQHPLLSISAAAAFACCGSWVVWWAGILVM
uniref:Uncharacterized protein n=1 Tax=Eutreptiella gymnastica TaxID=73025 RepID=A0A7S4G8L0_9EUGL